MKKLTYEKFKKVMIGNTRVLKWNHNIVTDNAEYKFWTNKWEWTLILEIGIAKIWFAEIKEKIVDDDILKSIYNDLISD